MSKVVLLGTFKARSGSGAELIEVLTTGAALAKQHEPGLLMAFFHSSTVEDEVIGYEQYENADAFAQHRANYDAIPEYAEIRARLSAVLASPPEVTRLELVGGFSTETTAD